MKKFVSFQPIPSMFGILICLTALCTCTHAAVITWTGAVGTNWMVAANWSPQTIPGANDQAIIADMANDPVLPGGNSITLQSLTVQTGGKLTVQSGASLFLSTNSEIIFQNEGEITNFGFVNVNHTANGVSAIINKGVFNNEYFAVLMIEKAGDYCISNFENAVFNNRGTFNINGYSNGGIGNLGTVNNHLSGFITVDNCDPAGISNFINATFINEGKIWLGTSGFVGYFAIINAGTFHNKTCNAQIRISSSGRIEGSVTDIGTFLNEGSIIQDNLLNSRITTNTGVLQNLQGAAFSVVNNSGYVTTGTERIWTGCTDAVWSNSVNWAGGAGAAPDKDVLLLKGHHHPVISGLPDRARTLTIHPDVTLTIEPGAVLEITGPGTNGILSDGTIRNAGQIHVGTTGTFTNTGILNRHEFVNLPAGTVTVNKTVQTAVENAAQDTFINAGIIRIGHQGNAGATGLLNQGVLENSGELFIDRISGTGLLNDQRFTNPGTITFGSLGIAGATALENRGQFFNKDLIDFLPGAAADIEIAQTAGHFTNERCARINLQKRIALHAPFYNQGVLQLGAATTSSSEGPHLTNSGILHYVAANYIPNTVNEGIIIRPMPDGQCNVFSDALEVGDLNGFTVSGSWYKNPPLNQLGGSYSAQSNTLTILGIATGLASNYYFTVSDPECGIQHTFRTSGTMAVDASPPQVVCPPDQTVQLPGAYTIASPVSDNCPDLTYWSAAFSGNTNGHPADFPAITYGYDPGPATFQPGVTTVTLGATDGQNSAVPCSFTVTAAAVLPVELSDFRGQAMSAGNRLEWTTATEKNVAWHILERSETGVHWTELTRRQGQVQSTSPINYEAFDPMPYPHTYYRLRTTDLDGSEQIGPILSLAREGSGTRIESVYPVPFTDRLTLQFGADREHTFLCRLVDLAGRVVAEQSFPAAEGAGQMRSLEWGEVPVGGYWLVVEWGGGREVWWLVRE